MELQYLDGTFSPKEIGRHQGFVTDRWTLWCVQRKFYQWFKGEGGGACPPEPGRNINISLIPRCSGTGFILSLGDFPELFVSVLHRDRVGGQATGEIKLELEIMFICLFSFSSSFYSPSFSASFFLSFLLSSLPSFLLLLYIIFKTGVFYT